MYLREVLFSLVRKGVTTLPADVKEGIAKARSMERNRVAKAQLSLILKNIELAETSGVPICQDTGIPVFYVGVGRKCSHLFDMESELAHAVGECTRQSLLRPNVVEPISRKNSGNNCGRGVPIIHYRIVDGSHIDITFVPKGAGTENMGRLFMLRPGASEADVQRTVLKHVREMGGKPCPPYILGIGIGGTSERCMEMAKLASVRKLGTRNGEREIARLERTMLGAANRTGIGPMGLGGKTTCLGVNIETASCHTATMPLAIAVSCWASRRASVRLHRHRHEWVD